MLKVALEITEWNQILAVLYKQPWDFANPLILKIRAQTEPPDREQAAFAQRMSQPHNSGQDVLR